MNLPPYRPARHVSGLLEYIIFYVFDQNKQDIVRKRKYIPCELKGQKRKLWIKDYITKLNNLLEEGYYIPLNENEHSRTKPSPRRKSPVSLVPTNVVKAMKWSAEKLGASLNETTQKTYRSAANQFVKFLCENKFQSLLITELKKLHAILFDDWMVARGMAGKTRNSYRGHLRTMLFFLKERGGIEENPFSGFRKAIVRKTEVNLPYKSEAAEKVVKAMTEKDYGLYLFTRIIYYTFARPVEITRLRVRHVNLKSRQIHFTPEISKRGHGHIDIYDPLFDLLIKYLEGINNPDHFLITAYGKPGIAKCGKNTYSSRHRTILKGMDLFGKGYNLYSWKHTGVCEAYLNGMDLLTIQTQCRHKSLEQTQDYLRDMGMLRKKDHLNQSW